MTGFSEKVTSAKDFVHFGGPAGGSALERASPPLAGENSKEKVKVINIEEVDVRRHIYVCIRVCDCFWDVILYLKKFSGRQMLCKCKGKGLCSKKDCINKCNAKKSAILVSYRLQHGCVVYALQRQCISRRSIAHFC